MLPTKQATTLDEWYALDQTKAAKRIRIDRVWERYVPQSFKESTREKRGTGIYMDNRLTHFKNPVMGRSIMILLLFPLFVLDIFLHRGPQQIQPGSNFRNSSHVAYYGMSAKTVKYSALNSLSYFQGTFEGLNESFCFPICSRAVGSTPGMFDSIYQHTSFKLMGSDCQTPVA